MSGNELSEKENGLVLTPGLAKIQQTGMKYGIGGLEKDNKIEASWF